MAHTFSKSAFYSSGDFPLAAPLPLIFSHLREIDRDFVIGIDTTFTWPREQSLPSD